MITDFEQKLTTLYSQKLEDKKNWYSAIAKTYDLTRPRYPEKLLNKAVELTQLSPQNNILEIGCASGIATTFFARLGVNMICLEPSKESSELAIENCSQYPQVEILNLAFEEWSLEPEKFNIVLAATSFHWISPEVGYQKVFDSLVDRGFLVLLWNTPPQPNPEVLDILKEVYQTHNISFAQFDSIETHQENISLLGREVINSRLFENLVSEQLVCEVNYNINDYLGLLSTLSPYINLSDEKRNALFSDLRISLENNWNRDIPTNYLSMLQVARKA